MKEIISLAHEIEECLENLTNTERVFYMLKLINSLTIYLREETLELSSYRSANEIIHRVSAYCSQQVVHEKRIDWEVRDMLEDFSHWIGRFNANPLPFISALQNSLEEIKWDHNLY